ncbi:MAG: hypothetical protein ACPHID_03545 [Thermoplasmatota archaeon]
MSLLMLTCLGALDGTIVVLAASGRLSSLSAAILVGLTVVSGTGAWITARNVFAGRKGWHGNLLFGGLAAISIGAVVAAAWLGSALSGAVELHILPKVAGIVLVLVAAEVGGIRLPRLRHAPAPVVALVAGLLLEGGYWIL